MQNERTACGENAEEAKLGLTAQAGRKTRKK